VALTDINRLAWKSLVSVNGGVLRDSHIRNQITSSKACWIQWTLFSNLGRINGLHSSPQVNFSAPICNLLLNPSEPLGPDIGFHFRFTRFCLSTYSVQNLKLVGANGLSNFQQEALNRSVAAAASFCKFTLELGPAIRDAARYMADFGFVMISFACIFIIQAYENFHSRIDRAGEYLSDVEAVAQMLKEFAVNSNHGPSFQARIIMARLQKVNENMALMGAGDVVGRPEDEMMNQQFHLDVGDEAGFMNDPLWDLLDFFPDVPAM
jgi:hypothetical protein